jgi:hypothetical protein
VISCIGPASDKLARHESYRLHLRNMSYLSRMGQSVCTQEAFRQRHLQGSFTLPLAVLQPLGLFLTAILCAMHISTAPEFFFRRVGGANFLTSASEADNSLLSFSQGVNKAPRPAREARLSIDTWTELPTGRGYLAFTRVVGLPHGRQHKY